MVTINTAEYPAFRTHLVDRATKRVDWAAVERQRRVDAARVKTERIAELRHIVFHNAARGVRDIESLASESDAAHMLISASNQALGFYVLAIVRVAVDNRWHQVVRAGIRYFGEHPVAARIQELWNLTTDRAAV